MIEARTSLEAIVMRVKQIVAEIADADPIEIGDEEPLFETHGDDQGLGLDSLEALKLGLALAEEYGLDPDMEVTESETRNVRQLAEYVRGFVSTGVE